MKITLVISLFLLSTIACNNPSNEKASTIASTSIDVKLKEETVSYNEDTIVAQGYLVFDENKIEKRPAILIVHEWWGLNDYAKNRAKQLATMGYVAMAVDMYGKAKQGKNPDEAQALAMPFYQNPVLAKTRLDAALETLKQNPFVDTTKIVAIGYCFGGYVVLNAAKQGAKLNGVVSFHGNLTGVQPNKDLLNAKILVCHGAADKFISQQEVDAFKKGMDSIHADYSFIAYDSATHAFTNPMTTEIGKKFELPIEYNENADKKSWADMKNFFEKIFNKIPNDVENS